MKRRRELTILGLITRLCIVTQAWTATDPVPEADKTEAREIGRRLHELGAFHAMRAAYDAATDLNRYASPLNYYWNGIGTWQA